MKRKNLCLLLCAALMAGSLLPSVPAAAAGKGSQSVEAAEAEGFALDERETKTGKLKISSADDEIDNGEARSYLADEYVYADPKYVEKMDSAYCYYYNHMTEKQKGVYAAFMNAAQDPMDLTVFHFADKDGKGYTMTSQEVTDTYQGFLFDHPECWWMGLRYLFSRTKNEAGEFDNNFVTGVRLYQAYSSQEDWKADTDAVEKAAGAYLHHIDQEAPEAVIALELHDRLIDKVDYDNTADKYSSSHNASGALVSGSAVCDGYALAYKYLLYKAGINCTVIPGSVKTGKHAWTVVSLGGDWYETDPTWNDQKNYAEQHLYYNVTTEEISGSVSNEVKHTREYEGFTQELPTAEGTHFTYDYMKAGLSLDEKPDNYTYMGNTNLTNALSLVTEGSDTDDEWTVRAVDEKDKEIGKYVWKLTPSVPDGLTLSGKWTQGGGSFKVARTEGNTGSYTIRAVVVYDNGLTSEPSVKLTVADKGGGKPSDEEPSTGGDGKEPEEETPSGSSEKGTLTKKGKYTYCVTKDGKYLTGFQEVGGELYYFDPSNNRMVTGWNTIDKKKYYMRASDGVVRRGMRTVSGTYYYFDPKTGAMQTGYQKIGGSTYYFNKKTGARASGWQTIGDGKAYFDKNGRMYTGIQKVGDYRYYFDPKTGLRAIGFTEVDGSTYYMNKYGRIQTGLKTIGGFRYYFASSGKMQTGWQTINGKKYYFYKKGTRKGRAATGAAKIGDTWYTFSDKGVYRKKGK